MLPRSQYPCGPLDFFDTLVTTDWQARLTPFTPDEIERLKLFQRRAGELGRRTFFRSPYRLTVDGDGERVEHAGEDALRSMALTFRHLWAVKEPARFQNVRKLVASHNDIAHPDARHTHSVLRLLRARYAAARTNVQMKHVWKHDLFGTPKQEFTAEQVIDDWINGEAFHTDIEKADRVSAWSPIAYESALISSIYDVAYVAWELQLIVADVLTDRAQISSGRSPASPT